MKPLAPSWKHKARPYRFGATYLGGEGPMIAWQRRAVVPFVTTGTSDEIAEVLDATGANIRSFTAPTQLSEYRLPVGPTVVWPEETLVLGVESNAHGGGHRFDLMWLDLDGTSQVIPTDLRPMKHNERAYSLTTTVDGAALVSVAIADASPSPESVGWPLPARLEILYSQIRRRPFDDHDHVTACFARSGQRWQVSGRVACVADDILVFEEGSGNSKQILGRRASDGEELWRIPAADRFVLGAIPLPAWSDDRFYVVDRADRRREAWAREAAAAAANNVTGADVFDIAVAIRNLGQFRDGIPLAVNCTLYCFSTRTGAELWHTHVDGDIVSFHAHPSWIAVVIGGHRMGTLRSFRHDGTPIVSTVVGPWESASESTLWPPDPSRWPCIAAGDERHAVIALNRARSRGGSRLYCTRIDDLDRPVWETTLPGPCVGSPMFRWLRLLNRLPMVFTGDAAFLRWGKHVHGFVTV